MNLEKTIIWIDKTEGRDKFCKIIQYLCRFLKFQTADKNKELSQRFHGLFVGMRDARKLFRLFKSINEYQKIIELIKKGSLDPTNLILQIGTRLGFLLYWFFDNIAILCAIKFINREQKGYAKKGCIFWFLALVLNLIQSVRQMIMSRRRLGKLCGSNEQNVSLQKEKDQQKALHATALMNTLKCLGDMITAGQGSEIVPLISGANFNDGWIGFGGLLSSLIATYQLYL